MQRDRMEALAILTAGANDPASIGRGTDKSKPSKADMAFILKGMSELQMLIIMAKYADCTHSKQRLIASWSVEVLKIARARRFSKRLGLLPIALATIKEGLAGRKFSPAERTQAMGKPKNDNKGHARLGRYQEIMDAFMQIEQAAVEVVGRNINGYR